MPDLTPTGLRALERFSDEWGGYPTRVHLGSAKKLIRDGFLEEEEVRTDTSVRRSWRRTEAGRQALARARSAVDDGESKP